MCPICPCLKKNKYYFEALVTCLIYKTQSSAEAYWPQSDYCQLPCTAPTTNLTCSGISFIYPGIFPRIYITTVLHIKAAHYLFIIGVICECYYYFCFWKSRLIYVHHVFFDGYHRKNSLILREFYKELEILRGKEDMYFIYIFITSIWIYHIKSIFVLSCSHHLL